LHKGPPYLEGGPFNRWLFDTSQWRPSYHSTIIGGGEKPGYTKYKYIGGFCSSYLPAAGVMPSFPYENPGISPHHPAGESTWGDFSAEGARGWAKFRPAQPEADLAVFIGELSDTPRMLKTTAQFFYDGYRRRFGRNPKGAAKKAADYWLTTQFGWRPFLRDLRSFYKVWKHADQMVNQIRRDNGQWIRRRGSLITDEKVDVILKYGPSSLGTLYPSFIRPNFYRINAAGGQIIRRVTRSKAWFEAAFRYYIPNIESVEWSKTAVSKLYGMDVTPSVVWNLIPWSWLVDWFTNVGSVITNLDNGLAKNLAAKYAYVMGTQETKISIETNVNYVFHGPVTYVHETLISRKTRTQANPFGFGLSWSTLTPRQWSILGALGISRMH